VVADNVDNLTLSRLKIQWPDGSIPADWGDELPADETSWRMDQARVAAAVKNPPKFEPFWGRGLRGEKLEL
jgi:hypothetical protein